MTQILLSYTYKGLNSSHKNIVRKKLLGHIDTQKQGKYRYIQKGLLDFIPHKKLQRGVIILKKSDSSALTQLLNKYEVKYEINQIGTMV